MEEEQLQTHESPEEAPEPIRIVRGVVPKRRQRGDDVVLTQCMLCVLLVLLCFGLHWLRPAWQQMLLDAYAQHRDAPTVAWLEQALQAIETWLRQ